MLPQTVLKISTSLYVLKALTIWLQESRTL